MTLRQPSEWKELVLPDNQIPREGLMLLQQVLHVHIPKLVFYAPLLRLRIFPMHQAPILGPKVNESSSPAAIAAAGNGQQPGALKAGLCLLTLV